MDDLISRQDAIRIVDGIDTWQAGWRGDAIESMKDLPSAQPEKPTGKRTETHGVCLDAIDRQATIDALEKVAELFPWRVPGNRDSYDHYNEGWNDAIGRAEIEIEKLPSAQPEVLACGEGELSAQPERKKGKWIEHNPHKWGLGIVFECSECGEKIDCEPSNFCPNCGADMREDGASNADVES